MEEQRSVGKEQEKAALRGRPLPVFVLLLVGLWAAPPAAFAQNANDKISPLLQNKKAALDAIRAGGGIIVGISGFSDPLVKLKDDGRVQVYVHLDNTDSATIENLRQNGMEVELVNAQFKIAQGWFSLDNLANLAGLNTVTSITPPAYATYFTGSVNSQGDAILKADQVRALGFDGAGIKVGIISNGVNSMASAVASGDLPANVEIMSGFAGNGEEGTAMLEIVHDLAPGASLAFAGPATSLEMSAAIQALEAANCQVICDDLGVFTAPYFEDGPIAQTANAAAAAGHFYCSAAGNHAQVHYEGTFSGMGSQTIGTTTFQNVHDFGAGDGLAQIFIPAGDQLTLLLQWANQFGSATDDYAIHVIDSAGTSVLGSSFRVNSNADPLEGLILGPVAVDTTANVLIEKVSGNDVKVEFFLLGSLVQLLEHNVTGNSIVGHQSGSGVFTVGAIDASDPGNDNVETFSSQGPSGILFPAAESRNKPQASGIDGVAVTGSGGFSNPFFGTSAAAPHIAGCAALLLHARNTLTPAQVTSQLQNNAVDIEAVGFDPVAGSGRVDVLAAVNNLGDPAVNSVSFSPNPVLGGQSSTGTVALNGAVFLNPVVVTITSSDPQVATVNPAVITFNSGQSSTFTVTTQKVGAVTNVTITATDNNRNTVNATLAIQPPSPQTVTFAADSLVGGNATTATVTLNDTAPAGGMDITLSSSNPSIASVPTVVSIPAGQTTATFNVAAQKVPVNSEAIITAAFAGLSAQSTLNVNIGGGETSGGGGGGCFIATAAYGTPLHQKISSLSAVRDRILLTSGIGSDFVRTYYANSPTAANAIRKSSLARSFFRRLIDPIAEAARTAGK